MTDEEIEKKAKEYAKGNYYSEQGFLYGYELGLEEGRKEICEKFLEEVRTHEGIEQMTKFYIGEIIKDIRSNRK